MVGPGQGRGRCGPTLSRRRVRRHPRRRAARPRHGRCTRPFGRPGADGVRSRRLRLRQRREPSGVHDRVHGGALRREHGTAALGAGRGGPVGSAAHPAGRHGASRPNGGGRAPRAGQGLRAVAHHPAPGRAAQGRAEPGGHPGVHEAHLVAGPDGDRPLDRGPGRPRRGSPHPGRLAPAPARGGLGMGARGGGAGAGVIPAHPDPRQLANPEAGGSGRCSACACRRGPGAIARALAGMGVAD